MCFASRLLCVVFLSQFVNDLSHTSPPPYGLRQPINARTVARVIF